MNLTGWCLSLGQDYNDYLKCLEDPSAIGSAGVDYCNEIIPIISEVLDELKANGKIKSDIRDGADHMHSLMENMYTVASNGNLLLHNICPEPNGKSFLAANSQFGFNENNVTALYIDSCVLSCILHTELFKSFLLHHLKEVDYKVANFSKTLERAAPTSWNKLKPYVDSKFRNSLAHGTWAIENKQVVLFEDARFQEPEKLDLAIFLVRTKKQNMLYACLIKTILEKAKMGLFLP